MLSKCANPGCAAAFRYLHQGKLFLLEMAGQRGDGKRFEYFWLCEGCARTLTVAVETGQVVMHPLRLPGACDDGRSSASSERLRPPNIQVA